MRKEIFVHFNSENNYTVASCNLPDGTPFVKMLRVDLTQLNDEEKNNLLKQVTKEATDKYTSIVLNRAFRKYR
jgi:hypothetical protein